MTRLNPTAMTLVPADQSNGNAAPRPRAADRGLGSQSVHRLARDVESLEAALAAAERVAGNSLPSKRGFTVASIADVDSRRAELDRWEAELQERERRVERQRMRLERIQEQLHRAKASLKRALFRFQSDVAVQTEELQSRSRKMDGLYAELVESRREVARELIRHKAYTRDAIEATQAHA